MRLPNGYILSITTPHGFVKSPSAASLLPFVLINAFKKIFSSNRQNLRGLGWVRVIDKVKTTRVTGGLHCPYKGLLQAKPKGSRILFLLHLCPAADFIGGGVQSFRLAETFPIQIFSLGLNVYNLCLYSTISLSLQPFHIFFLRIGIVSASDKMKENAEEKM